MKTRTITTYSFDELSETAKQKALKANRYWYLDDPYWYVPIDEMFEEKYFEQLGIEAQELYFDLDRANYAYFKYQTLLDVFDTCQKLGITVSDATKQAIDNGDVEFELEGSKWDTVYDYRPYEDNIPQDVLDELKAICGKITNACKDLQKNLLQALHDDEDCLLSDEAITNALIENEVEFLEDGTQPNF